MYATPSFEPSALLPYLILRHSFDRPLVTDKSWAQPGPWALHPFENCFCFPAGALFCLELDFLIKHS